MRMTAEQRGIYRELLAEVWIRGSLPADEHMLFRMASCTPKEWARSRDVALACSNARGLRARGHGDGREAHRTLEMGFLSCSKGVPIVMGKANPVSSHRSLAMARSRSWRCRWEDEGGSHDSLKHKGAVGVTMLRTGCK